MVACQAVITSTICVTTLILYIHFLRNWSSQCPHVGLFLVLTVKLTRSSGQKIRSWGAYGISHLFPCCGSAVSTLEPPPFLPRLRERSFPITCPCPGPYTNSPDVTRAERTRPLASWVRYFDGSLSGLSTPRAFGSGYRAWK